MPELRLEGKALEEAKSSAFSEAEKLLAVAEKLEQIAERQDNRVVWTSFLMMGIAAALTLLGLLLLVLSTSKLLSIELALGVFLVAVVQSAAGVMYCWSLRTTSAQTRDDERRLMQRLIDMLRELEGAFAHDDTVSILERVGFQTRLARHGIGPSSRPNQNGVPR